MMMVNTKVATRCLLTRLLRHREPLDLVFQTLIREEIDGETVSKISNRVAVPMVVKMWQYGDQIGSATIGKVDKQAMTMLPVVGAALLK